VILANYHWVDEANALLLSFQFIPHAGGTNSDDDSDNDNSDANPTRDGHVRIHECNPHCPIFFINSLTQCKIFRYDGVFFNISQTATELLNQSATITVHLQQHGNIVDIIYEHFPGHNGIFTSHVLGL
jgi:hypothetical protein